MFTVDNTSQSNELGISDYNMKIIQNKQQFSTAYIWADYDDLNSSVPFGVIEKGWVIFEPLQIEPL